MSPCIFPGCVSTDRHWHGGFPGGYTNPADPEGPPIPFATEAAPGVRDYNGALLTPQTEAGRLLLDAGLRYRSWRPLLADRITAIEREAVAAALAEVERRVQAIPGAISHATCLDMLAVFEVIREVRSR